MNQLTGKVGIVTGGSAGIGRAAALALAAEGAAIVVADIDVARGEEVVGEIEDKGGKALFVHTDVSDDADVAALVARTVQHFGGLDLAFNNAGVEGAPAVTHECPPENWQRTLAVNLTVCGRACGTRFPGCSSVAGVPSSTARRWRDWLASARFPPTWLRNTALLDSRGRRPSSTRSAVSASTRSARA